MESSGKGRSIFVIRSTTLLRVALVNSSVLKGCPKSAARSSGSTVRQFGKGPIVSGSLASPSESLSSRNPPTTRRRVFCDLASKVSSLGRFWVDGGLMGNNIGDETGAIINERVFRYHVMARVCGMFGYTEIILLVRHLHLLCR
jgi:hypothetical protein